MSFETITVRKRIPVINGFVRIPNADNSKLTALTPDEALSAVSGSSLVNVDSMNMRNNKLRGRVHNFNHIEFPETQIGSLYPDDWYADLNDAAE